MDMNIEIYLQRIWHTKTYSRTNFTKSVLDSWITCCKSHYFIEKNGKNDIQIRKKVTSR